MRRRRRMKDIEVRKLQGAGLRCPARHPNWQGVRCDRMASDHRVHHSEARTFEWDDARTLA